MAAACILAAGSTTFAQPPSIDTDPSTPGSCDSRSATFHAKSARVTIRAAFNRSKWRQQRPARPEQLFDIAQHRECLTYGKDRKALTRYKRGVKARFYEHRAYRRLAPYVGFRGEGYWLRWLPIPRYVVACETSGYSGESRWHARNPSSAGGPAQVMAFWGAPHPALTDRERLRYWRITRSIWLSSGPGAWVCA